MKADTSLHALSAFVGLLSRVYSVRNVRNILVYRFDHLGDVLMTTPALAAIREKYRDAHITIVVGEWSTMLLTNTELVDEVVIYNSPRFTRAPYRGHRLRDLLNALKARKYDVVIGLRYDWATIIHALIEPRRHIERGTTHLREWLRRHFTKNKRRDHEIDRTWNSLAPIGISARPVDKLTYSVSDEERVAANDILVRHNITHPFAVVHAGTSHPFKEWSLDRFAELVRYVVDTHRCSIVLVGSPDESGYSAELLRLVPDVRVTDISGMYGFRQTAAIVGSAILYVGSDGGLMHVAAALGVPTVGLFGPGSHEVFGPVGINTAIVTHAFHCSPCNMTVCVHPDATCMMAITVADVIRVTDELIGKVES